MTRTQLITLLRSTAASQETLHHVMHVWKGAAILPPPPSLDEIFAASCLAVGTKVSDSRGKSQTRANSRARFLFCYHCRSEYEDYYSLKELGEYLNGRDHTTVIHARDTFVNLVETGDKMAILDLENLHRTLKGEKPLYEVKQAPPPPKKQKYIRLFYERNTGRYYSNIKSIRSFYGFGKHVKINRFRFTPKVLSLERLSEIDLF